MCKKCENFNNQKSYTKYHKNYADKLKGLRRWNKFSSEEQNLFESMIQEKYDNSSDRLEKEKLKTLIFQLQDVKRFYCKD